MVAAGKECQFGPNWAARMVNLAVAVDQVGSRIGIKFGCNWTPALRVIVQCIVLGLILGYGKHEHNLSQIREGLMQAW